MFNMIAEIATDDIKIKPIKTISQSNLNKDLFVLSADSAISSIVRLVSPKLDIKLKDLPKDVASQASAMSRGAKDIFGGLPFTATIQDNPYGLSGIKSFAVRSSSRPEILYTPTDHGCDCEGSENHGVCKHRLLRPVFVNYIRFLRAHEALIAAYARAGIRLMELPPPTVRNREELSVKDLEEMMNEIMGKDSLFNRRGI